MQKKLKQKEMWVAEPTPFEWVERQVSSSLSKDERWSWRPNDFCLELALAYLPDGSSLYSLTGLGVLLRLPQARPHIPGKRWISLVYHIWFYS